MEPLGVAAARELLPDGAFVRLQNRAQQTYLDADDDGEGVSLRPHGPAFSLSAVWRVQHVQINGEHFVLFQGAAYGRYLAVAPDGYRWGYRGRRAVQRDYGGTNFNPLLWRPSRARMVDDDRYIVLSQASVFDCNLRANGRYQFWNTAVTADESEGRCSTMMQWTVRRFQLAPGLPPLPLPTVIQGDRSKGLLWWRRTEADEQRTIRYVRANDEGDFDQNSDNWATFPFPGRSVFNLMTAVGLRLPDGEVGADITMAVRPGLQGRLTPLVTDLPRSVDPMDIVVFDTGSQGAQNFVYPDIP